MLFHGERHGEDFAQGFHGEGFVNIANLVDLAVHRGNGDGKVIRAVGRQGRDVVGDFSIVVTFIFLMCLVDKLCVIRRGLRESRCAKQNAEGKNTHAEKSFSHGAILLVCSSWCRMAAYRLIRPTDS